MNEDLVTKGYLQDTFDEFERRMDMRFTRMDEKFDALTDLMLAGFDNMNARFDSLEARVDRLEAEMKIVQNKLAELDKRLTAVEYRLTVLEGGFITLENDIKDLYGLVDETRRNYEKSLKRQPYQAKRLQRLELFAKAAAKQLGIDFLF